MKLTTHLPNTAPQALHTATTHPFLRLAGSGQIPKPLLSQWLSQDRLYAQSYVRFIGMLLAKIHLPASVGLQSSSESGLKSEGTRAGIEEKVLDILIEAITNIRTELKFFEDVAGEYSLDLNVPAGEFSGSGSGSEAKVGGFGSGPITQSYIDMFMSAGSPGASLLEGLVVLWATEVCYLRAWRYAASFLGEGVGGGRNDADGGALRERFIPNWASEEFEGFVERIGVVVDEVAKGEGLGGDGDTLARCERWWRQVVWLEERFWPVV
ncbi:hypothetical protein BDW59DRAFT_182372 [Aspergillus cavernicola]|uniref:Thiaminase-2/PQQC domain-containing protein n=1 Tax=Aspergillus cavernicola TaxID=176166 RepID=A0ABR4HQP0_9EURO